ncbi:MAG: putative nucleoside-diphosphate-sugar epimerase [halophilic archaeon J07HX64]|jgi:Predicted nucleoside-diphosphate-sugar epimerases|nr:MAG: putative nucleoside-diphosphate-sugar epimerase [halophilic archaeon J07HX64]
MDTDDVDTVLVAGASGATGLEVLRLLGSRVPTVRGLTRSPGKRRLLRRAGADEVAVDDLLDPTDLAGALDGVDVVVSAVGSGVGEVLGSGPYVDGEGARALLDAAVTAGVEAFVMESAIGVGDDPASPLATAFDLFIGPIQEAKAETEAALRSSPLRHTVLRPGVLTNGPRTDDVTVAEPGAKLYGAVSRADVARLLVAAPVTEGAADATFEVVGRPAFPGRATVLDWQLPGAGRTDSTVEVDVLDDVDEE